MMVILASQMPSALIINKKSLKKQISYCIINHSRVAQPVEQAAVNRWVVGSSPTSRAKLTKGITQYFSVLQNLLNFIR